MKKNIKIFGTVLVVVSYVYLITNNFLMKNDIIKMKQSNEKKINRLQIDIEDLGKQINYLENQNSNLESDIEDLKSEVDNSQSSRQEIIVETKTYQSEN